MEKDRNLNDIPMFLSLLQNVKGTQLYNRESLIVFDEVQAYPKARQAIKHLVADGRYDYIETGSLVGIMVMLFVNKESFSMQVF